VDIEEGRTAVVFYIFLLRLAAIYQEQLPTVILLLAKDLTGLLFLIPYHPKYRTLALSFSFLFFFVFVLL
jgi:hypothetical protein